MKQFKNPYTYYIFILKAYLEKNIGIHYPREIIKLIIMINYAHIKISCGMNHTILVSNSMCNWGIVKFICLKNLIFQMWNQLVVVMNIQLP